MDHTTKNLGAHNSLLYRFKKKVALKEIKYLKIYIIVM